jgi:cob(I)alamin adenosyltransferase
MTIKGYIHIYTGNGKGKTTAAFGLALRAAGYRKKVYIGQFIKDMQYHETSIQDLLHNIKIEQLGNGCFLDRAPAEVDCLIAQQAFSRCAEILSNGDYDLVILDEINIAVHLKLLPVEDVIAAIIQRAPQVEVVLTGRYAPAELIAIADLVTEMKELKHYYYQGILARPGIEY